MLEFSSLQETISTASNNKLRTFFTGFAVAWGILLLILLLAAGKGLKNGVIANFAGRAQNSVCVWPGRTSVEYGGFSSGREIKFTDKDFSLIENKIDGVIMASPRIIQQSVLSYGEEFGFWNLEGINANIEKINHITVSNENGRFINELDIQEKRKVIVISQDTKKILFKNENPLGKFVIAGDVVYEVIGVYDRGNYFQTALPAYIPLSVAQVLYCKDNEIHRIDFLIKNLETKEENNQFNSNLREQFGRLHNFDPEDRSALFIRNTAEAAIQTIQVFKLIDFFIFIVGVASLIAGIVGVGNIMLITVKERTHEIGIRKAIGAKPGSILRLIIMESILITSAAGYVGLLIGLGIIDLVNNSLKDATGKASVFKDPSVDLVTMIGAIIIIIICGVIAGLIPALRASKISPIDAMREE